MAVDFTTTMYYINIIKHTHDGELKNGSYG